LRSFDRTFAMYIAPLLTNPDEPHLTDHAVAAQRDAWQGGDIAWLSPGEAAEFPVPDLPDDRWAAWETWQRRGVDLVIQPAGGRRKAMLIADMDSTMIGQECIDELADEAGVGAHVAGITARAMNGELDFEQALTARVALLKGLDESVIDRVLNTRITLAPGGRELVATMKAMGGYTVLVSGGFTAFTRQVGRWLGFDETHANILLAEDGRLTGEVAHPILGREAKIETLARVTRHLDISEADAIAVGDGANDLGMLGRAGTGVALHAKPTVAAQSDIRINHGDLSALLFIQGYRRDEFAG
jgi:phosphoserine phosphatase